MSREARPSNRAGFAPWQDGAMHWNGHNGSAVGNGRRLYRAKRKALSLIVPALLVAFVVVTGIVLSCRLSHEDGQCIVDGLSVREGPVRNGQKTSIVKGYATKRKLHSMDAASAREGIEDPASGAKPPPEDVRAASVIVNDGTHRPPDRYSILSLNCDKQIAGLLYAMPGQLMIGAVDFGDEFERQFLESLKSRLQACDDSTEEEREMIEAVNKAKEVILAAMKAEGKTAGEVMREARRQMREFGSYRQMLKEELRRYESDEGMTDEDVSDLFDAANKLLKENGIEPFEPNDLTREVVRQHKFDQQERTRQ